MTGAVALDGVVRHYAWGSTTAIAQLLGREPDGRPDAELWFGAHPDGPSSVPERGATLDELIDADPRGSLGSASIERFGERLPFLLKILAAASPLSIQVHPTLAQAAAGFAAEDAAGVPRDAPERNYRDTNHKPELLCALTPFEALCGFRPVAVTRALLGSLEVPELGPIAAWLDEPDPLRAAFTGLLTMTDPAPLVAAVTARAAGAHDGPLLAARLAAEAFPGDVGVVLSLLLNFVRLEPGEAIFLGAGNVHAYLRGTGVEIMANSDNVLRCGLTGKHVDVGELLAVTEFVELAEPRWPDIRGSFTVPVPDFRLTEVTVDELSAQSIDDPGACIVLCTEGSLRVDDLDLAPGRGAFVPATTASRLTGTGTAFLASVGDV